MELVRQKTPNSFLGAQEQIDLLLTIMKMETGLDLKRKTRKREYVDARAITFYIIRTELDLSLGSIGKIFNKDHATVLHGLKVFSNLIETDKSFKNRFNKVLFLFKQKKGPDSSGENHEDQIKKLKNLYEDRIKVLLLENNSLKIQIENGDTHPYSDIKKMIYQRLKPKRKDEFKRKINAILNGM